MTLNAKPTVFFAILMHIKSTKGVFVQINKENVKRTYMNAKRTDIYIKQADAQKQTPCKQ